MKHKHEWFRTHVVSVGGPLRCECGMLKLSEEYIAELESANKALREALEELMNATDGEMILSDDLDDQIAAALAQTEQTA